MSPEASSWNNCFARAFEDDPELHGSDRIALLVPQLGRGGTVEHRKVTYRQFHERVSRLASALTRRGVKAGDRVLLMITIGEELYEAILALFKMGAVGVFIDPREGREHLERCLEKVRPSAFLALGPAHMLRLRSPGLRRIPLHVSVGGRPFPWPATVPWENLIDSGDPTFETVPVLPSDSALITFTSGTVTGRPRGANRTHRNLRRQFEMMARHEGKASRGVNFCAFPVLPLDDLTAGRTSLLPALPRGGAMLEAAPEPLLQQIREHHAQLVSAPPGLLERMVKICPTGTAPFYSVRHVYTGGGRVRLDLIRRLREVFPTAEVHVVYGSTESEPVSLISHRELLESTAERTEGGEGVCVGRPAPETTVRVIRPTEGPVEDGSAIEGIGELIVSGPHVNESYFEDEEETRLHKVYEESGGSLRIWHRLGDLGYLDDEGRIWLVGRRSQVVRSTEGDALHCWQVEPAMETLEGVEKAALAAVPFQSGDREAHVPVVFVEVSPEWSSRARHDEIIGQAAALAARRGWGIGAVQVVEEIPHDRRIGSKVQYGELVRRHGGPIARRFGDPWYRRLL